MPLLKHELWASIIADMEKDPKTLNNKIRITINGVNLKKRGVNERHIYHCTGEIAPHTDAQRSKIYILFVFPNFSRAVASECNRKILAGDLVVVANGASQFFAYVTDQRTIRTWTWIISI